MNYDCWYYVFKHFFNHREKHQRLKLVCKLFYRIVQGQSHIEFNRIKDKIYLLTGEGGRKREKV